MHISEATEMIEIAGAESGIAKALADVSISQVVYQRGSQKGGVADEQTFTVVGKEIVRSLTRELLYRCRRRTVIAEVLQMAFDKQAMIAACGELVVEFDNVGIEFGGIGRGKSVPAIVKEIADRVCIGGRVLLENIKHSLICSSTKRASSIGSAGSVSIVHGIQLRQALTIHGYQKLIRT